MTRTSVLITLSAAAVVAGALWKWGDQIEFTLGGAMINVGYRMQDRLEAYDFAHHEPSAEQVWNEFLSQNHLAASVRKRWARTTRHPVVAMVTCMDARLDTNEIAGDTRRYYYVLRLAGSIISESEEEMLELAVANGVKVVVFTTHTDCAAEKVAKDAVRRAEFPALSRGIDDRSRRFDEFLQRRRIREPLTKGNLLVKWMDLDTATEELAPHRL